MYEDLAKRLRERAAWINFPHHGEEYPTEDAMLMMQAADAIEELIKQVELEYQSGFADGQIAANRKKPRWIPVTERCPEKSGDYLVFDDCRNLYVNEWHCLLKKWQYDDSRITHWMPLPEPPKEET